MKNLILTIFCVIFSISTINAQVFTQTFRGYLNEEPVNFTLTFNRQSGKINGSFVKLKDGTKKPLVGEFYKEPKINPKPTPTPPNPAYQPKIDTTNYFNLYEVDAKTKKKVRRATLVLGEVMHGTWAMRGVQGLIDLDLVREFDGKQETYRINEKTLLEVTQKYEIEIVYPILSGENLSGIRSFNELIGQKIQATVLQFKQAAIKHKVEDAFGETDLKWKLTAIFHTKFSNDRFISLVVFMSDNMMDDIGNSVTETANFIVNFDLRNQKKISLNDIFEKDSLHLEGFSKLCQDSLRKAAWKPWEHNREPIPLQTCEPKENNFNDLFIGQDGLYFNLKSVKTRTGEIPARQMRLTFEQIEKLGGKFKKDGVLSELLEVYFRNKR